MVVLVLCPVIVMMYSVQGIKLTRNILSLLVVSIPREAIFCMAPVSS